ncbi:MAG: hypothetical protein JKY71_11870 [Alphaproteobacteria bacterium]|nr:hypothetical protein [Alphaproteobacteria bacterium]
MLATLMASSGAFAQERTARYSADYLLQVCSFDENGQEVIKGGHIACQGYIAGVMDYHNLISSLGTAPSVDFCVPADTPLRQVHMNIYKYLKENRHEQGPFNAAPGVALGLYKAYPCR